MQPKRFSVKYFTQGDTPFDLDALVPVFQRWIQQHTVEGLLIDVADYKHVYQGPGVLLIGHEGDYSYDVRKGRAGLLYTRKQQPQETLTADLQHALTLAANAARKLEKESTLNRLRFNYNEIEITFLDRLTTPNSTETFEAVRESVQQVAAWLYQNDAAQVESVEQDARKPLTVRVAALQEIPS